MSNSTLLDNIGCLYTANNDGVESYTDTKVFIKDGLISSIGENKDYLTIDCHGKW